LTAALLALAVVLIGFWTTFILPSFKGEFSAPAVIYVHGAFLFLWTLMLLLQASLIQTKKVRTHMTLGWTTLLVAAGVVFSTMATGVYVMKRDLAAGQGQLATSSLLGTFTTPLIFAVFVALAVKYRRRPEIHKRLMLLAMIEIIWPAFFRFRHYFPSVPSPEIYFAVFLPDLMIVFAMIWDKVKLGRVHPVYLIGGTLIIAENVAEVLLFGTPPWQTAADRLAGFFL
jgi:hypothetical protein